jgi:hypothetical protein
MSSTKRNLLLVACVTAVVFPAGYFTYLWTAPRVARPAPAFVCSENLRQIDGAKQQWVIEHETSTNALLNWEDIRPYFKYLPACPEEGTYTVEPIGQPPSCSISNHTAAYRASLH